jgi:hypothetical protein
VSPKLTRGKPWAYLGAILGGGVSVAANVAHSFLPPSGASPSWSPEPGAVVGAVVWPVFLFIAVEILARVYWPAGKAWLVLRFGGLLPVAGVAAFVSYRHLSGLLEHYGEEFVVVLVGPIAVDGLMLMATGALLAINHRTRAAAMPPVPLPAAPAVPVAPHAAASVPAAGPAPPAPELPSVAPPSAPVVAAPVSSPVVSVPTSAVPATPVKPEQAPATPIKAAASTTNIPVTASDAAKPASVPAAALARAEHIVAAHLAENGTPITINELAVRMRVGSGMATRLLEALGQKPDRAPRSDRALNGSPVKVAL